MRVLAALAGLAALVAARGETALVLGSGGLVGQGLVTQLHAQGWEVLEVVNRTHIDLRLPGALDVFPPAEIDIVYFLACEVGGSKFLYGDVDNVQVQVLRHNLQMYEVVWPWVTAHGLKTVFVSSQLQAEPTPYGAVKRLGESWAATLPHARSVRLWNVYGPERVGVKSHVANDWVRACLEAGRVDALTDGRESRQFLHTLDAGTALIDMAMHWEHVPAVVDLTSGQWVTLRALSEVVVQSVEGAGHGSCAFHWDDKAATGNIVQRVPDLTSAFHLYHLGVLSSLPRGGDASTVAAAAMAGTSHLLGSMDLPAGIANMVSSLAPAPQHSEL